MYTGVLALLSLILPNLSQSPLLIRPLSEVAILVTPRLSVDPFVWPSLLNRLRQSHDLLASLLDESSFEWVLADQSLTLLFPPHLAFPFAQLNALADFLNDHFQAVLADEATPKAEGVVHLIEVSYGGEAGEDLPEVAKQLGLSEREVVQIHTEPLYRVEFIGFLPGFAYLGGLPPSLHLPRRAEPRDRVPAGALAVASRYTAIYPMVSPGGWHLLGQSEFNLFSTDQWPPNRLQAGDSVRFVEV